MQARVILAVLAVAFLAAAALRGSRNTRNTRDTPRRIDAATRTWLLIALVFAAVAAWLQWHTS